MKITGAGCAQQRNAKDDKFCKIKIDEEAYTLFFISGEELDGFDEDFEDDECEDSA